MLFKPEKAISSEAYYKLKELFGKANYRATFDDKDYTVTFYASHIDMFCEVFNKFKSVVPNTKLVRQGTEQKPKLEPVKPEIKATKRSSAANTKIRQAALYL